MLTKKCALDVLGSKVELTGNKHDRRAFAPFETTRLTWNAERKFNVETAYVDQARILPQAEDTPGNAPVFVVRDGWRRAWDSAITHASTDTTRPHIATVFYDSHEDRLIGTDGHRFCAVPFLPRDSKGNRPPDLMLPWIHVQCLGTRLEQLEFWITEDGRVHMRVEGFVVSAPLYRGLAKFPPHGHIMPGERSEYAAYVDVTGWSSAVRKCPTMAGTGAIKLRPITQSRAAIKIVSEIENDKPFEPWETSLIMPGEFTWCGGTNLEGFEYKGVLQSWEWGVNAVYLADAIDAISPSPIVRMMMPNGPLDPFHIGRAKDEGLDLDGPLAVVMPCRI